MILSKLNTFFHNRRNAAQNTTQNGTKTPENAQNAPKTHTFIIKNIDGEIIHPNPVSDPKNLSGGPSHFVIKPLRLNEGQFTPLPTRAEEGQFKPLLTTSEDEVEPKEQREEVSRAPLARVFHIPPIPPQIPSSIPPIEFEGPACPAPAELWPEDVAEEEGENQTPEVQNTETSKTPSFKILSVNEENLLPSTAAWENRDYERAKVLFEESTGAKLLCPSHKGNENFATAIAECERMAQEGVFPKEIKYVVMGHGMRSSEAGNWRFISGGGQNVYRYIENNVPKGEVVLVIVCESGNVTVEGKPAVGKSVDMNLLNPNKPAKIVRSGERKVCGHFLSPREGWTLGRYQRGIVYY